MSHEFKTYLLLILALILFWLTGSFVDSALWFHTSYRTPAWVVTNLDIFWLVLSQGLWPLLLALILKPKFNTLVAFGSAACFGGVAWDLSYSLLTRGAWVSDSLEHWFTLGSSGLVIGIGPEFVWAFHILRLVLGLVLLLWLYRRSK
jgi:hypothetical protein